MFLHLICMSAYYFCICAVCIFFPNRLHEQIVLFFSLWNEYIWPVSHKWECCCTKYHQRCDEVAGTKPKSSHPHDIQYVSTTLSVITCNITTDIAVKAPVTLNITPAYNCTVIRKKRFWFIGLFNHLRGSANTTIGPGPGSGRWVVISKQTVKSVWRCGC